MTEAVPEPVTAVMDAASGWLPRQLAAVERRLGELAEGHGPELASAAGATVAAGGKRLRPLLVLVCAGHESGTEAVRAAVAVELVHTASLVHDDVLDAAPLRRGRPTVAAEHGRPGAIATGDLLFSRAFAELALNGSERQILALSRVSVGLAQGELAQRADAYDVGIGEERYLERCRLKTARLFESACVLGTETGVGPNGANVRAYGSLATFGERLGLAFQMLDDVLDVSGPPERTGKARGTDLLDGTVTLPLILAAKRDPGIASTDLRRLDRAAAESLCDRIAATGALEEVRSRAVSMVEEAKGLLEDGAAADVRDLLDLVADGVVDRYA
jgi:geranylgeranyl pyrophosphate synthase